MPEPAPNNPPGQDEALRARQLEQDRLRAALASRDEGGGGRIQQAAQTVRTAGRGVQAAGRGAEMAGKGAEAAGRGVEAAGKGVQTAGKAVGAAGRGMMSAGAALSSTGLGAIAGVPLAIAGGAVTGAGAGMQGAGAAASAAGKGVGAAGRGVSAAGRATRSAGGGLTRTGGMMSRLGGGVGGNMAQEMASKIMQPGGGSPPGVGMATNLMAKGMSKSGPAGEVGAAAANAGTAIQKVVKVLQARLNMWLEILNSYLLDIFTTILIMGHKIVTDKDIRAAAVAVKGVIDAAQKAVPGSDKKGGDKGGSPASGMPSIPKLAKWAIDHVETLLKVEWMLAMGLMLLQCLVFLIALISLATMVLCMVVPVYCLYEALKAAAT